MSMLPVPPIPGPEEEKHLPSVTLTGKVWHNGSRFSAPTAMQVFLRAHAQHLEETDYVNTYLALRYVIFDKRYYFWPNPTPPGAQEGWIVNLGSVNDIRWKGVNNEIIVIWNKMLYPTDTNFRLIRDFEGVRVSATLLGGNGEESIEKLHLICAVSHEWGLGWGTGFPINPDDQMDDPPGGTIINDP